MVYTTGCTKKRALSPFLGIFFFLFFINILHYISTEPTKKDIENFLEVTKVSNLSFSLSYLDNQTIYTDLPKIDYMKYSYDK